MTRAPLRLGIFVISAMLIFVGVWLVERSSDMPEWTDRAKARQMMILAPEPLLGSAADTYNARWYRDHEALRTSKWILYDIGRNLMTLGACLVVATLLLNLRKLPDIGAIQTPRRRFIIAGIATLAWFLATGAAAHSVIQAYNRETFPPWADSIAIPLFFIFLGTVAGWLVMAALTWLLALRKAKLPVSIFIWRKDKAIASWAFSIVAGVSFICVGFEVTYWLGMSFIEIPALLLWLYATLCVRAAATS